MNIENRGWGYVCDDLFITTTSAFAATAACRDMGFDSGIAMTVSLPSGNNFAADDVHCTATATGINDCVMAEVSDPFNSGSFSEENCGAGEGVGLVCSLNPTATSCVRPAVTTGYIISSEDLRQASFSVAAHCAAGYQGSVTAVACGEYMQPYSLMGCIVRLVCVRPAFDVDGLSTAEAYHILTENENRNLRRFAVSATCASGFVGAPAASPCHYHGGEYELGGCTAAVDPCSNGTALGCNETLACLHHAVVPVQSGGQLHTITGSFSNQVRIDQGDVRDITDGGSECVRWQFMKVPTSLEPSARLAPALCLLVFHHRSCHTTFAHS